MAVSFVPGEPNQSLQAVAQGEWKDHSIVVGVLPFLLVGLKLTFTTTGLLFREQSNHFIREYELFADDIPRFRRPCGRYQSL